MSKEAASDRARRAQRVLDRLRQAYPEARIELQFGTPMQLLVCVILSAQCTDERVNQVTPGLFARFPDAAALARARPEEVQPYIRACGLFRAKAKALVGAAQAVVERHRGEVPRVRAELESLPGVGRKTAGVVSMHLGGDHALPVDTHVLRLARRLGLSRRSTPDPVEEDLSRLWPKERWAQAHHLLIWHGRRTCHARRPRCGACAVASLCPKVGVAQAEG